MMGWCVGNLGWGNTEIRDAARKFDGPDYVHPTISTAPGPSSPRSSPASRPARLAVSYRTTGGTESVEGALQNCHGLHRPRRVSSPSKTAYHGNSIATMSIGASDNRETFKNLPAQLPQD